MGKNEDKQEYLYEHRLFSIEKPSFDPQGLVSGVLQAAKFIYQTAQLVKSNQQRCQRLAGRIADITLTITELNKIPDNTHFEKTLHEFYALLKECQDFMNQFSAPEDGKMKRFVRHFIKAGDDSAQFEGLNKALEAKSHALNLGLNIQQLFNHEQDKIDATKDRAELKTLLSSISQSQEQLLDSQADIIGFQQQMFILMQDNQVNEAQHFSVLQSDIAQLMALVRQLHVSQTPQQGVQILSPQKQIRPQEIAFLQSISKDHSMEVHLGHWNGQLVACKTAQNPAARQTLIREMQVMSFVSHPCISTWYRGCLSEQFTVSVMEYMPKGSLNQALQTEFDLLTPNQIKGIALNIARGLEYLQGENIIHADVRSSHVLLNEQYQARLTSFGLAKVQQAGIVESVQLPDSCAWQAPEVLRLHQDTKASDIYSFGVLLWEMQTGQIPWKDLNNDAIKQKVLAGERPAIAQETTEPWRTLMTECWQADPTKRPSWTIIIAQLNAYQPKNDADVLYERGERLFKEAKNYTQALVLFRHATIKNHAKACTIVGNYHLRPQETGNVVPENKPEACTWFLRAANAGHPRAMYEAAVMLEGGEGVTPDVNQAHSWYQKAAKAGEKHAIERCKTLGLKF